MLNFKEKVEEIQNRRGYCTLLYNHYATVDGIRTNCITGIETPVKVHWVIERVDNTTKVITFLNGVTGYEGYYIDDLVQCGLLEDSTNDVVVVCAGTNNKYDTLTISRQQLQQIVRDAVEIYK